ncbi:MAG: hypothetical protein HOF23_02860 [Rhodospirillaceae bacterium]|nr:hypothetical protein [Rhodospirillaceae bacterium]
MALAGVIRGVIFGLTVLLSTLAVPTVHAADPFEKVKLTPAAKTYLVIKDINVRQKPLTKSKRVGRFKQKSIVQAVGKAKGTEWIAVKKDGKNFGFVYGTALVPMIDGKLTQPINGNLSAKTIGKMKLPPCHYKIHFEGRVKVEGDLQITSDYQLPVQCDFKKKTLKFTATMFMTELPYLDNRKPIYQINVDVHDIPMEDEDVFSSTILYHILKKEITFDGVNKEDMRSDGKIAKMKAASVIEALKGAVAMAHQSWGPKIWAALAKTENR